MSAIRALIVDDEPLARELLRSMLAEHDDIEVVGECGDGASAVRAVLADRPDLLFLDIQMPERDGFEVLQALGAGRMPAVIFVTAYDQYAIRAFEVHALDYLLKPFDDERLERAVARAREQLAVRPASSAANGDGEEARRILDLLERLQSRPKHVERLPIKVNDRVFLQPVREIEWLEAAGKHVHVHVGRAAHTIRETMQQLERQLDPERFLRVSRSAIVNVDRIREIQPWFHGDYVLIMTSGAQVTSTRGYRQVIARLLGKAV